MKIHLIHNNMTTVWVFQNVQSVVQIVNLIDLRSLTSTPFEDDFTSGENQISEIVGALKMVPQ
jgi:hypothetical protein